MRIRSYLLSTLLLSTFACGNGASTDPGSNAEPFDLARGTELARLSLQAYQQLEDFDDGVAFTLPEPFTLEAEYTTRQRYSGELLNESEDRPIAFVAARGDERFVVFRGTQTIAEWTTNITYSQLDYPFIEGFGRSHRGFTRVYQSIRDELLATLTEDMATGEVSRLWITGHSLGGALAAIAAPDLIEQTGLDTVVYSFAAPRAGDPAFRERFGDMVPTSWRTINTRDLVPDLPPRSVLAFEDILPEEVYFAHTKEENPLTYAPAVNNPFDFEDLVKAHDLCRLHGALCDTGDDPASCRALAVGIAGCDG